MYVPRNLLINGNVYLLRGILFKDAIVSTARLQNMLENLVAIAGLAQGIRFSVLGLLFGALDPRVRV